nr:MAG: hypothetical protein KatS3mg041_0232 [Bacteroidota bacterium]
MREGRARGFSATCPFPGTTNPDAVARLVLEKLPDPLLVLDRRGAPVYVNGALRALLGDEITQTWSRMRPQERVRCLRAFLRARAGAYTACIVHLPQVGGESRPWELFLIPWGPVGRILGVTVRFRDVGSESAFRLFDDQMAAQLSVALYRLRSRANGERHYLFMSPVIGRITGYPPAYFLQPGAWLEIVHPEDRAGVHKAWAGFLQHPRIGHLLRLEHRILHADGQVRWVLDEACWVSTPDGEPCIEGMVLDLTERKQVEQALVRAREQAEEASRMKSTFLANMSHEIRTPLASILGFAELLQDELSALEVPQHFFEFLEAIRTNGRRLLNLINDILDFSKIEAGRMELRFEPVSIPALVDEVISSLRALAENKGLYLQSEHADRQLLVTADPQRLSQILINLISNGIRFTERGGVHVRTYRTEEQAVIEVRDTGIGISEQALPRLGKEFFQDDSDPNRPKDGTGLGLAISMRLARLMGGTITVQSQKGAGSTFTVLLPIRSRGGANGSGARPRVLIVEDIPENAQLLTYYLREEFDVHTVPSAEEALQWLEEHHAELLLVDVYLGPGMDGVELVRRLRSRPGWGSIPIIAQTAYASVAEEVKFLQAGFNALLTKPVSREELLSCLRRYLGQPAASRKA